MLAVGTEISGSLGGDVFQYSEGTWTPDLRFNSLNTGITYSSQAGQWIRKGDEVTVWFDILLTSKGAQTGSAQIYGLPFTSFGIIGSPVQIGIRVDMTSMPIMENRVEDGNTVITLGTNGATSTVPLTDAYFTNTTRIAGSATYRIA